MDAPRKVKAITCPSSPPREISSASNIIAACPADIPKPDLVDDTGLPGPEPVIQASPAIIAVVNAVSASSLKPHPILDATSVSSSTSAEGSPVSQRFESDAHSDGLPVDGYVPHNLEEDFNSLAASFAGCRLDSRPGSPTASRSLALLADGSYIEYADSSQSITSFNRIVRAVRRDQVGSFTLREYPDAEST